MKAFSLLIILNLLYFNVTAQQVIDCGVSEINTGPLEKGRIEQEINSFNQLVLHSGENVPQYVVRLYVRIIRDDQGRDAACTVEDVIETFKHTKKFFDPHGICLQLVGIDFIDRATLLDIGQTNPWGPHLRDDCLTMFVVKTLENEDGELGGGNAYRIPNRFFAVSAAKGGVDASKPGTTTAHEIGHCLGLLHTFETAKGTENVTRDKNNSCFDCEDDGDYLCDTPADPNKRTINGKEVTVRDHIDGNCNYVGVFFDNCNEGYRTDISNVMAYSLWRCVTKFTQGQGARMRAHLKDESILEKIQAKPTELIVNPVLFIGGNAIYTSRLSLIITSPGFVISNGANGLLLSQDIIISQQALFTASGNSDIEISTNMRCN